MTAKRIENGLMGLAAFLLLALMAVTGIDVIGRYLFNAPLSGAFELTELLLGALVFVALPLVSRAGAHVEVDLLVSVVPRAVSRVMGRMAAIVSAVVLAFFAWRLAVLGITQVTDGARSVSMGVPLAPFAFLGALTCLVAALFGLMREMRP
ncbi:TRAP transporter small permease [Celeribacter ethanolicus]|uniref:TRAP transporter small permease protein n=1 Tax=Celeribacter ethanolicus TaxID=1758178 RepID=A0A291GDW2_9RHOB|nr:TRAP transporter small permease [Celeribacter ethanolicus]ATG48242.1 TRAP transporter small permease [Celeribacter ethanolicus]TNE65802.1 MAG: TRAP transporter small permease [Paracoccaceae bacterium]